MRYLLSLTALITLLLTACHTEQSSDVNQNRIYTQYELVYNADEDITYARAWFRFGNATGTQLELSSPSEVTFEGEKLSFVKLLGYYEKKFAGLKNSGVFKWEDTEGTAYENTVALSSIAIGSLSDTLPRTAALNVPWTGDALSTDDVAVLWVNGSGEGDAQAAISIEDGAGSIILPLDKVSKISAGKGKIYLERRRSPDLVQKTDAGGTGTGVYRAKTKEVVFE